MIRWLLGGVGLVVAATVILVMAVTLSGRTSSDVTDLEVGDCFDLDPEPDAGDEFVDISVVDPVDCDDPHNAQVVVTADLNPDHDESFPGDGELWVEAEQICRADEDADARFGILPITPTEATWEARRGRMLCVAVSYGGVPVEGDHRLLVGVHTAGGS